MKKQYSIGSFSKMTNITPRTLQYYDEIGLLCAQRTKAGHRFYTKDDIVILQRIVSLKFLGYSLEMIKELLENEKWDTEEYFTFQRNEMIKKRDQLNHSIRMLEHAQKMIQHTGELDPDIFFTLINGVQMEDEHKKWLTMVFPTSFVEELYQMPIARQQEIEERFIMIMRRLKEMNLIDPNDEKIQEVIHEIFLLIKEAFGGEIPDILSQAIISQEDIKLPEEDEWIFPQLLLSLDDEAVLAKALEIYLERGFEGSGKQNEARQ